MHKETERALREIGVSAGDRILVAVSGGADSVALLHLMLRLSADYPFSVTAAHLDHALREESGRDASFVAALCSRLSVPLFIERTDVAAEASRQKKGIEEAAREIRLEFLERTASAHGCRWIALGHHRGDQAETVLHRLIRGTSLPGLAGIPRRRGPFIRPLLELSRSRILSYLDMHRLSWVEDPSNTDPRYTRNRLRHQILPALSELNPRIEEHLGRLGSRVALEEDFWRGEELRSLARLRRLSCDESDLDCAGIMALHPALRMRVLRRAVEEVRGGLEGVAAVHLEAIAQLIAGEKPQAEAHLPGLWAGRRYGRLRLRKAPPLAPSPFRFLVPGPGLYPLPNGSSLGLELADAASGEERDVVEFDADGITFPLTVRTFTPGDRFRPDGTPGKKKLKDFFIDQKLDGELRRSAPLVEGDEILWIVGLRRCHGRYPRSGCRVLRMRAHPPKV